MGADLLPLPGQYRLLQKTNPRLEAHLQQSAFALRQVASVERAQVSVPCQRLRHQRQMARVDGDAVDVEDGADLLDDGEAACFDAVGAQHCDDVVAADGVDVDEVLRFIESDEVDAFGLNARLELVLLEPRFEDVAVFDSGGGAQFECRRQFADRLLLNFLTILVFFTNF
ncbi:hypothetical protein MHBO_004066 [Bonamia ostreae]|uniref:Uncharacterized protein n=1 Tax=Bonamia ostreae TaxID=126728 RepID=A0ABV2ASA7_9EUKA